MTDEPKTTDPDVTLPETPPEPKPKAETTGTSPSGGNAQPHEDWEKRFKGMQKAYNTLQDQHTKQATEFEEILGQVEELRAEVKNYEGEKQGLQQQISEYDQMKADLETQIKTHSLQAERAKLIMSDFTDLAAFEAQGLLPQAETTEEMQERFEAFRQAFNTTVEKTTKNRVTGMGTAPSSNEPPKPRTKETVYAELTRLAGAQSPEQRQQYDILMQEWMELNKD